MVSGMARDDQLAAKVEQSRERLTNPEVHDFENAEELLAYSRAIDPNTARAGPTKSLRTVETYTDNLRRFQNRAGACLTDMDTEAVLSVFNEMAEELAAESVSQYQSAVKDFYRWHDGHDVDPDEIAISSTADPGIDEQSVLSKEEYHKLRDAASDSRARCIIDLLGYTGQRVRVIQTLRVKDVAPENGATGSYWINTDAEGLKGAEKAMSKRPLLGAKNAVKEWLDYHPTGNPEDYLITTLPSSSRGEPGSMVAQNTIRRAIKQAAEKVGIEKPVNPHAFRHFFATAAKRDYDMDDETIRRLLGHGAKSRIMETTYRHLSDHDVISDAERSYGVETEEDQGSFTPPVCPTCDEPLSDGSKACSNCGAVFSPDAEAVQEEVRGDIQDSKEEADELDEYKKLDKLERMVSENPELIDVLESMADD